jgi:hypothetical protein
LRIFNEFCVAQIEALGRVVLRVDENRAYADFSAR